MPDSMNIRLHLRRLRVVEVVEDTVERLVVAVQDLRTVVRCPHCGFLTARVGERRRVRVYDLPHGGRATVLMWLRRRFSCRHCGERHTESHPEIRGKVTRRLARQLVRDARGDDHQGHCRTLWVVLVAGHVHGQILVLSPGDAASPSTLSSAHGR